MKLPWELSYGILKGLTFLNLYRKARNEVICRSALPDNVFDSGERPTKLVQKRVKVGFFWKMKLTI